VVVHDERLGKGEETDASYKMILLMAVSHGCILEVDNAVTNIVEENDGVLPEEFKKVMTSVFSPLKSANGRKREAINEPDLWAEEQVSMGKKDDGEWVAKTGLGFVFSPNALSLFLEKTLFPRLSLASPPINERDLNMKRVWWKEAKSGILATLIGVEKDRQKHDATLLELEYHLLPYKISERTLDNAPEIMVMSEYIFAHEKEEKTSHAVEDVSAEEVLHLLNVLKEVRHRMTRKEVKAVAYNAPVCCA